MTLNTNELAQLGNSLLLNLSCRHSALLLYISVLLHKCIVSHLSTQRNDAVASAKGCRRRYIERLFRKLAIKDRLISNDDKTFMLSCGNLGPHNVLVNVEFKIVAVIDWEFAYSALSRF